MTWEHLKDLAKGALTGALIPLLGFAFYGSALLEDHVQVAHADAGWQAGAPRIERGSYGATRLISGSSFTGTAFFSDTVLRPDGICYNNTASTVWVGTQTATQIGILHDNIRTGFPVPSSATFRLDGSFRGTLALTCDTAIAACEFRCLDGLVVRAPQ